MELILVFSLIQINIKNIPISVLLYARDDAMNLILQYAPIFSPNFIKLLVTSKYEFKEELGRGSFGIVNRGIYKPLPILNLPPPILMSRLK